MAQSNIYGAGAASIFELFGDYVEGDAGRAALVLASKRPCDASLDALDKSFAAFGYGTDAFSVATIEPLDASAEGGDIPLDSQLACLAYRSQFEQDAPARVLGRPAVMFRNLDALMESDAGKQKAWKLLKSLPRQ